MMIFEAKTDSGFWTI